MRLAYLLTAAKFNADKDGQEPTSLPMRPLNGVRRNPSTDQKKARRFQQKTSYVNWEDESGSDEGSGWFIVDSDGEQIAGPFDSKSEAEYEATDSYDDSEGEDGDAGYKVKRMSARGRRLAFQKNADADTYEDIDAAWNAAYWSGRAQEEKRIRDGIRNMLGMKGQRVVVVRGRKVPVGTSGICFYVGEGQWGWRVGFTTDSGETIWTNANNVELSDEKTASRKTAVRFLDRTPDGKYNTNGRSETDCPKCGKKISASGHMNAAVNALQSHMSREHGENHPTMSSRKTAMPSPAELSVKVGDIFYNSWGYDQTNVDFYEVIRLTGQGVEVQPIESRTVSGDGFNDMVVAVPGFVRDYDVITGIDRSDARKSKVCRLRDSGYIVLSRDHTAAKWDGRPLYESGPYGGR